MNSHFSQPKKHSRDPERSLGSTEITQKAGISLRQLYHWVDTLHVARPQLQTHGSRSFRRFSARDLVRLKHMKELVSGGYTPHAAAEMVTQQNDLHRDTAKVHNLTPRGEQ